MVKHVVVTIKHHGIALSNEISVPDRVSDSEMLEAVSREAGEGSEVRISSWPVPSAPLTSLLPGTDNNMARNETM